MDEPNTPDGNSAYLARKLREHGMDKEVVRGAIKQAPSHIIVEVFDQILVANGMRF
jgi:hypothetical protein